MSGTYPSWLQSVCLPGDKWVVFQGGSDFEEIDEGTAT